MKKIQPAGKTPQTNPSQKTRTKTMPLRTSKTTGKTALLPEQSYEPSINEEASQTGFFSSFGQEKRRTTAYCTAEALDLKELAKYLKINTEMFRNTVRFDEVLYTVYAGEDEENTATVERMPRCMLSGQRVDGEERTEMCGECIPCYVASERNIGEIFFFDYGVTVFWGLGEDEEKTVLDKLVAFETCPYNQEDIEIEDLSFAYSTSKQSRIINDLVILNDGNKMVKLALSHAFGQSALIAHFESRIDDRIDTTKQIPTQMAKTGEILLKQKALTKLIGELFVLRVNVNLNSNVLDEPEIFWSETQLEPHYRVARKYMDIPKRVDILNHRCSVLSDLLDVLQGSLETKHGMNLEKIIIVLITIEMIIGLISLSMEIRSSHK
ncbi:MAG: sporulation protein Rmd1 [Amphiamblys sp. WSBS2006]|nr:MAG: sporulation protein Rmd1 [Amphiamblys sp. WSBS2006]